MLRVGFIAFLLLGGVTAVIVLIKSKQFSAPVEFELPPETVTSAKAKTFEWDQRQRAVGTLRAERGVVLTAETSGVVERILFQSGHEVEKGILLLELDAALERAQREAVKAQLELAEISVNRIRMLVKQQATSLSELDAAEATLKQARAELGVIDAQIGDKQLLTPFDGRLGIRRINQGEFLERGQPIVTLESTTPMLVDFSVPQQQVGRIGVGDRLELSVSGESDFRAEGRITAIDPRVDPATRSLEVEGQFDNPEGIFLAGMFVEVEILAEEPRTVVAIPAGAVLYQPYGNLVYVIEGEDGGGPRAISQRFVRTGERRGDYVEVVSGVEPGDEVVSAGAFKLSPDRTVIVDNSQALKLSLEPTPENR